MSATRPGAGRPRRPGRPLSGPERDVRRELLTSARDLFLRYGYRAVSGRQVASAAGVNPAMIQYYFGSKQGLYAAMLHDAIGPLITRIEALLAEPAGGAAALPALLDAYMHTVKANPWVPGLLMRDVLAPDGDFRDRFIDEFASRLAPRIASLVQNEIGRGALRSDLDPVLTVVSFLSLGVWPFLAMPVLRRVLALGTDGHAIEQLIDHTVKLFAAGTAAGGDT